MSCPDRMPIHSALGSCEAVLRPRLRVPCSGYGRRLCANPQPHKPFNSLILRNRSHRSTDAYFRAAGAAVAAMDVDETSIEDEFDQFDQVCELAPPSLPGRIASSCIPDKVVHF